MVKIVYCAYTMQAQMSGEQLQSGFAIGKNDGRQLFFLQVSCVIHELVIIIF